MNTEKAIEILEIKQEISSLCKTKGAKIFAQNIKFLIDYKKIEKLLSQTSEMKQILLSVKPFPNDNYIDIREEISLLKIPDTCISQETMKFFLLSYNTIKDIIGYFDEENKKLYPQLSSLSDNIIVNDDILKECNKIIDVEGEIKDSYSSTLRGIRAEKHKQEAQKQRRIQSILNNSKTQGWTNEDDELTIRNNHIVVPVKASYKRQIKGILHDTSSSGQTFFIEPEEIVEINFSIRELEIEEKQEIHRILMSFSEMIRGEIDEIIKCYNYLIIIDFIKAKAEYAIRINAGKPILSNEIKLSFLSARHPLLEAALKKNGKKIAPLDITLTKEKRILIISGPNAGGKSVCLKTVALLQYMLQCGLLVPMKEISEVGIFNNIFISIGDEQSLENDLSTYSSHLINMKTLCERADFGSLFLIDECGTGTDPTIGGAIAESVLEYLNKINCFGVVTTHYSNLKHLALKYNTIVNGAMLFDKDNMMPLYTLSIGNPGSSFAFEIASKIGLSKEIIDNAKKKIGQENISFEQDLQQIQVEKREIQKEKERMKSYDDTLYEMINKYKTLNENLENQRKIILNGAREQAKEILDNANKKIEKIIEEIKTNNAEKTTIKQVKEEVKQEVKKIEKDIKENKTIDIPIKEEKQKKTNLKILTTPIVENDYVVFGSEETVFTVMKVKKDKLEIENETLSLIVPKDNVKKIEKQSYIKQNKNTKTTSSYTANPIMDRINSIRIHFNPQIDLRGKRTEVALKEVAQHLDTARLLGEKEIKILHGKGDGILKTMIRQYLSSNNEVKTFYPEKVEFGGEGITIVELN
jgi:DNA mismatch repair protein MutS2